MTILDPADELVLRGAPEADDRACPRDRLVVDLTAPGGPALDLTGPGRGDVTRDGAPPARTRVVVLTVNTSAGAPHAVFVDDTGRRARLAKVVFVVACLLASLGLGAALAATAAPTAPHPAPPVPVAPVADRA